LKHGFLAIFCFFLTFSAQAGPKFDFKVLSEPLVMPVRATAYTHTEPDHIAYGRLSAYGNYLKTGEAYHSVAADWSFLPVGSVFRIKGYGPTIFVVDDYGSALTGKDTVDLYFETPEEMNQWGARNVEIEILRIGDFRKSYLILRERARWPHCYVMAKQIYDRYQKLAEEKKAVAKN
jgi:3D (Asp-Asp-Asp) domain-containing protein